jgi:hypothetical protein
LWSEDLLQEWRRSATSSDLKNIAVVVIQSSKQFFKITNTDNGRYLEFQNSFSKNQKIAATTQEDSAVNAKEKNMV